MRTILRYLLFGIFSLGIGRLFSQTALVIPDTLSGTSFTLNMHRDSVQFFPTGSPSYTYAFNAYHYLGPTLLLNKGDHVTMHVQNNIGDTTSVHWHGLHVPAMADGGPHTPILPGDTWNPDFTVMDHAATYWYHPHMHMKTAVQAIKGAAGMIIVRDPIEAALNLPRTYGVDDFPIIVQCQQYDSMNQAMPLGMVDSTILVNGARANDGYSVYGNFPAQMVRMRLLNASGERVFNFGFSGNKPFKIITSDGGLLNAPVSATRIRLAPGERAEIVLDLSADLGQTIYLMSYASELAMGIQGGPTMPMPSGPPMNSPLNGIDFQIMTIHVVASTAAPVTSIPAALTVNTPYSAASANITRTIRFTADSFMVMDGPFYFNDSSFNMMRVDYEIPLNNIEIWKLVNETMVAHPFHIHDVQFYLIDHNGSLPSPEESGRKDVVLIPTGDSVMFITKFEDFADSTVPYMFHCHILMHEDAGMMGQFVVKPSSVGIQEYSSTANGMMVLPNPASSMVTIRDLKFDPQHAATLQLYDGLGRLVYSESMRSEELSISTDQWARGLYQVRLIKEGNYQTIKLVVQ